MLRRITDAAERPFTTTSKTMKKLLLYSLVAITAVVGGSATADAKSKHRHHHHYERHDHHYHHHHYSHRTRELYFIERDRPVRRVVYVHPSGYYYHMVSGRPVRIRERYYTSYPSRYYYPDGRRRIGIRFFF